MFRDRYSERGEVYARFDAESAEMRQSTTASLDISYGAHPRCKFDLFRAGRSAPLVAFIHGGYWQSLSKDRYSFVATPLIKLGISITVLGYPLVPDTTVSGIINSVLSGLTEITGLLEAEDSTPDGIVISGHSAGGHLATCAVLQKNSCLSAISASSRVDSHRSSQPLLDPVGFFVAGFNNCA